MTDITLTLIPDEANAIAAVLDNLPTSSNAWPLVQKVKMQITQQIKKDGEEAPNGEQPQA